MKKYRLLLAVLFLGSSLQAQVSAGFEFADYDTTKIINGSDGKTTGYYGNADNNGSGMYFYAPIQWDTAFGGYWKSGVVEMGFLIKRGPSVKTVLNCILLIPSLESTCWIN